MRKLVFGLLVAAVVLVSCPKAVSQETEDIVGIWQGTLNISGIELRLVFKIERAEDGTLTALMDSPDQSSFDNPVDSVSFSDGKLDLAMPALFLSLSGKMAEDGQSIDCQFTQGGMQLPLALERTEKEVELNRPQTPEPPYPYDTLAVTFENKTDGVTLAGTLTLPQGEPPFAAAVLITGSGAQDRDEMIFAHRPFLVIADFLTRNGIAVLRYDDRGMGASTGHFVTSTSEDFARDAQAGVEFLRAREDIENNKIGLIGHSEGGMIAPMIAAKDHEIGFVVMMAGTGVTGEEILIEQSELISVAENVDREIIEFNLKLSGELYQVLKSDADSAAIESELRAIIDKSLSDLTDEQREAYDINETMLEPHIKQMVTPWFRFFVSYDPAVDIAKVKCPVLVLNGELDLQVSAEQNVPAIEKALQAGGNTDYKIHRFERLNHLFQTCETGAVSEYGIIEETISPKVLQIMGEWITTHAR